MVAGGSDILRTPRPGEHKRRTVYERRVSRRYTRPPLPPTIAKDLKPRPLVPAPVRNHMVVATHWKESIRCHIHGIGSRNHCGQWGELTLLGHVGLGVEAGAGQGRGRGQSRGRGRGGCGRGWNGKGRGGLEV